MFIALLFVILGLYGLTVYFSREIVYPKVLSHDHVKNFELENNNYDPSIFQTLTEKDVSINSYFGYTLKGKLYLQEKTDKFVLMCHGITSNYDGMMKYCEVYINQGYSIFLYDHRNHGYSDRNYTSFGFYEKKDAKRCVDYLMKQFDEPAVGVHGISMGAATALQLATIDDRLSFCVEDCGFSDMFKTLEYRVSDDHHPVFAPVTHLANLYVNLFYKFNFTDTSVVYFMDRISCPVMFIHGEEDKYVPYYMVHDLYEAFDGEKVLYSVPNAKHANSIDVDRQRYHDEINQFLLKITSS